jgi:hypothetical protein
MIKLSLLHGELPEEEVAGMWKISHERQNPATSEIKELPSIPNYNQARHREMKSHDPFAPNLTICGVVGLMWNWIFLVDVEIVVDSPKFGNYVMLVALQILAKFGVAPWISIWAALYQVVRTPFRRLQDTLAREKEPKPSRKTLTSSMRNLDRRLQKCS